MSENRTLASTYVKLSRLLSIVVLLIAGATLAGWIVNLRSLAMWWRDGNAMNPMTAVSLLSAAAALRYATRQRSWRWPAVTCALALPPLLIGGNSHRAIRRAVELGDAWNPFFTPKGISSTSRTAELTDEADLSVALQYLRDHCEKVGRDTPPEIILGGFAHVDAITAEDNADNPIPSAMVDFLVRNAQ